MPTNEFPSSPVTTRTKKTAPRTGGDRTASLGYWGRDRSVCHSVSLFGCLRHQILDQRCSKCFKVQLLDRSLTNPYEVVSNSGEGPFCRGGVLFRGRRPGAAAAGGGRSGLGREGPGEVYMFVFVDSKLQIWVEPGIQPWCERSYPTTTWESCLFKCF